MDRSAPGPTRSGLEELLMAAFPGARLQSVAALAGRACPSIAAPGGMVIRQGEPGRSLLVLDGCLVSRRTTSKGRRVILALAKAGSILIPAPTPWQGADGDVVAVMPTRIVSWSTRDLRALAAADPGLALALVDLVGRSLSDVARRLDRFVDADARDRLLGVLAEHPELFFGDPPVVPRTMLPELVAISREMTDRVVRGLERDRVIERVGRRGLKLLDPLALESAGGTLR